MLEFRKKKKNINEKKLDDNKAELKLYIRVLQNLHQYIEALSKRFITVDCNELIMNQ